MRERQHALGRSRTRGTAVAICATQVPRVPRTRCLSLGGTEVLERLAEHWWHAHRQGADGLMIAARRSDVADLNQRARDRMRVAERLRGDDGDLARRSFVAGDRVVLGRNAVVWTSSTATAATSSP